MKKTETLKIIAFSLIGKKKFSYYENVYILENCFGYYFTGGIDISFYTDVRIDFKRTRLNFNI